MLAVKHANVAARGCSNAEATAVVSTTMTAATAATAAAAVAAAAVATTTSTGVAGVVATVGGRAESASRGCWCLIAPTKADSSSHIASASPILSHVFLFLFLPYPFARLLVLFFARYSRNERVCYSRDGRAFRGNQVDRPTDPPTMAAAPGLKGARARRRDATRASP